MGYFPKFRASESNHIPMKLIIRQLILLVACVLAPIVSTAQANYSASRIHDIGKRIFLLEDELGSFTINEVVVSKAFVKSENKVPNMGVTTSSFWLKIPIKNSTDEEDIILMLEQPFIDAVELYSPREDGAFELIEISECKPFSERKYDDPNYLFDIHIPSGEKTVFYMKVSGKEQIQLPC
ncbi:MAG: hypothetical protein ACI865_001720 [Flavobacteriaceae bacterium]|jgi:hypothetical protein